ncbi:MAG: transcription termination/antitermination protein NusA [Alphaproteobacteria bacterium]|nr:MAG: transcription termination/antitermination protein NusA [Alphaproteobacteria bacterium]
MSVTANRLELLQVADALAREKAIDREIVLSAMEEAIQKAAKSRYGAEHDIRAQIDRKTGETRLFRVLEVVEDVEDPARQITLEEARAKKPDAEIGDFVAESLPPVEFGRIAAQTARQIILQKVRDAERERQYNEYKDRVGEIVTGVVKRVEYGNVILDLGRAEAIMRRDQQIPREHFHMGDRVRGLIYDVRRETRGPQIFMSRAKPEFMAELFKQEVPEVYEGIVEIKAVARDPGSRAKIAVLSHDPSIDPVGACVGMRGSRVQAVVNELHGEKIDIIPYDPDPASFIISALAPAEVTKVVLDEEKRRVEVVVPDEQLSLAIGRRGQNVRLASQLTGWTIDILTAQEESERRQQEFKESSERFMRELDVDETLAQLLVVEGFSDVEEIALVEPEELLSIEGFDEDLVAELQRRAREALERREAEARARAIEAGAEEALVDLEGMQPLWAERLAEAGIKTVEDLAGFAVDELISDRDAPLRTADITREQAEDLIMQARLELGWITEEDIARAKAEAAEAEAAAAALPAAGEGESAAVNASAPATDSPAVEA